MDDGIVSHYGVDVAGSASIRGSKDRRIDRPTLERGNGPPIHDRTISSKNVQPVGDHEAVRATTVVTGLNPNGGRALGIHDPLNEMSAAIEPDFKRATARWGDFDDIEPPGTCCCCSDKPERSRKTIRKEEAVVAEVVGHHCFLQRGEIGPDISLPGTRRLPSYLSIEPH